MSKVAHCFKHSVPRSTFTARLKSADPNAVPKRGRPPLFAPDDRAGIVDAVAGLLHLNLGKANQACIDMIQDTHPEYNRRQVHNAWHRSIKPHGDVLDDFKSQGSSNDRSGAITKANQTHHYHVVDAAMGEAKRLSTEACAVNDGGKTWSQVAKYFVANLDEANNMANAGSKEVVGDKTLQKHERNSDDNFR